MYRVDVKSKFLIALKPTSFSFATVIANPEPSALIFNPSSVQPLEREILVADDEYIAVQMGSDEYTLITHGRNVG